MRSSHASRVAGGITNLAVRGDDYSGAEIMSRDAYGAGTFTIKGRCNVPAGAMCAFFLYETGAGERADEIDIEIIPATEEIWFTVWNKGQQVFHSTKRLAFDPAADLHTYVLERAAGEVRFLVDGVVLDRSSTQVPQAVMPLLANAWWPTWLNPSRDMGAWEIDYISVSA